MVPLKVGVVMEARRRRTGVGTKRGRGGRELGWSGTGEVSGGNGRRWELRRLCGGDWGWWQVRALSRRGSSTVRCEVVGVCEAWQVPGGGSGGSMKPLKVTGVHGGVRRSQCLRESWLEVSGGASTR